MNVRPGQLELGTDVWKGVLESGPSKRERARSRLFGRVGRANDETVRERRAK